MSPEQLADIEKAMNNYGVSGVALSGTVINLYSLMRIVRELQGEVKRLRGIITRVGAMCGNPDAAAGCRNAISLCNHALAEVTEETTTKGKE